MEAQKKKQVFTKENRLDDFPFFSSKKMKKLRRFAYLVWILFGDDSDVLSFVWRRQIRFKPSPRE